MGRVFLIVLDSCGIGGAPDASLFHDEGSDTLAAAAASPLFSMPNMREAGLFNINGVTCATPSDRPSGAFARVRERSMGKDTTTGHWEIAGVESPVPMPTFPNGFPHDLIEAFELATGRKVICNRPYSGTAVIADYGREHVETGALIVYTSADSVFQVAAHEDVVPIDELYHCCQIARDLLVGDYAVGRVIARPFDGEYPNYSRTSRRHDFSLNPPTDTMLDYLSSAGRDVLAVGKINDIFAGRGVTDMVRTANNAEGIQRTLEWERRNFEGLCFTNLVDFDMLYGHRNDVDGYARALAEFDRAVPDLLSGLREDDLLMVTADHGCDPSTPSTDHSRECVPWVILGPRVRPATNLGTLPTYGDIAATILDYLQVAGETCGTSQLPQILCD